MKGYGKVYNLTEDSEEFVLAREQVNAWRESGYQTPRWTTCFWMTTAGNR
jgi:hypothetical protein